MKKRIGRYSKYIRPLTILFDVSVINLMVFLFVNSTNLQTTDFLITSFFWILSSFLSSFYKVYRFTRSIQIVEKSLKQFSLFTIFTYAYIGFVSKNISNIEYFKYLFFSFIIIVFVKFAIFNALKVFRKYYNGNQRRVVVIGNDVLSNQLITFFNNEKHYGYHLVHHYKNKENAKEVVELCLLKGVDEIYFSLENATKSEINKYVNFVDNNFKTLKYIPTKIDLISQAVKVHYYDYIPVIPMRKFPLQQPLNKFIKRLFDLVVSILIIVFVLSWLVPLIGLLIKLESKGPVFFNQKRNGLYYSEFTCFKFRSMYVNNQTDNLQATKNDKRITNIGKFLRKSSLDEMPQFLNVFIGNMSICGPRPHPVSMTHEYEKKVAKFKLRHHIKPGITGMAQTHGYRGEIETNRDIVNRVKYDIFYLENSSLLLDVKIVYLTIRNAILGDKKAY